MVNTKTKIMTSFVVVCVFCFLFFILGLINNNSVGNRFVLKGYKKSEENMDKHKVQDFTDYCKYYYDEEFDEKFASVSEYKVIQEEEVSKVVGYFDNFKQVMEDLNRKDEYDFDTSIIDAGDFVFIASKEGRPIGDSYYGKYDAYTVYFYDLGSHTLYYIHFNI